MTNVIRISGDLSQNFGEKFKVGQPVIYIWMIDVCSLPVNFDKEVIFIDGAYARQIKKGSK